MIVEIYLTRTGTHKIELFRTNMSWIVRSPRLTLSSISSPAFIFRCSTLNLTDMCHNDKLEQTNKHFAVQHGDSIEFDNYITNGNTRYSRRTTVQKWTQNNQISAIQKTKDKAIKIPARYHCDYPNSSCLLSFQLFDCNPDRKYITKDM